MYNYSQDVFIIHKIQQKDDQWYLTISNTISKLFDLIITFFYLTRNLNEVCKGEVCNKAVFLVPEF